MGTTDKPQATAGVTFKLLGATLNAGVTTDVNGQHIFLHEDVSVANNGINIKKLVDDVNELIGTSPDKIDDALVQDKLAPLGKGDVIEVKNVTFKLVTAYLDIKIPKTGPRTVEYAFRLDVDAKGLIKENIEFINIDRLTIAVWNTTNPDVIKQLNLDATK